MDFEHVNLDLADDETLFGQSTGDWWHVTKTRSYPDESLYTIGFKDAADALVVQAVDQGRQDFS